MSTPLERVRDRLRGAAQAQSHVVYVQEADLALLLALADACLNEANIYDKACVVEALAALTAEEAKP